MIEIARILCPIDLSDASRRALDHAVALARWYGSVITVLRVVAPVMPVMSYAGDAHYVPPGLPPADLELIRDETARFAAREAGGPAMATEVIEGDAADAIAAHARDHAADLIVLGTHGRRGLDRLMLGSVTERVLRRARCPVLTVPPSAPDAVPPREPFKRVLCAVDFSASSLKALDYASSIAKEAGAALTVVHAAEHLPIWPMPASELDTAAHARAATDAAAAKLRACVAANVRTYADVEEIVVEGKAYKAILQLARERHSELIVIGAHGGLAGLLAFGSTTSHVVREAACPVLSLRA